MRSNDPSREVFLVGGESLQLWRQYKDVPDVDWLQKYADPLDSFFDPDNERDLQTDVVTYHPYWFFCRVPISRDGDRPNQLVLRCLPDDYGSNPQDIEVFNRSCQLYFRYLPSLLLAILFFSSLLSSIFRTMP